MISKTEFPVINSNVYKDDKDNNEENDQNYFKPYHVFEKEVEDESGQNKSENWRNGICSTSSYELG